jgi:glycosyltransferase involved in cell wall biosynthesis
MKLISTTLTGNHEDKIGDALKSVVDWVDQCLVIDTGVTDRSMEVAREIAKDKYVERTFPWINDFAAARNFALDAAHELGGTWSMSLDTDERIETYGEDVRAILEASTVECYLVTHFSETHLRERIFRLPAKHRFVGPTHESYPGYDSFALLEKTRCVEIPKTPEEALKKFVRDAAVLTEYTSQHPDEPRWHYYLGDTLHNLRRHEEAIEAYMTCAKLRGWNEESAWACYRAAECHTVLGQFDDAVAACAAGLVRHPGIAELPRLAAYACYRAKKMHHAVWWARMSVAMGLFEGDGARAMRLGFRNINALYEGPYDVLRFALATLGDAAGAREADQKYHAAIAAREAAERKRRGATEASEGLPPQDPLPTEKQQDAAAS